MLVIVFQTSVLDTLKYKIKNPNTADALAMRTIFEPIKSLPKFNVTYANRTIANQAISWELFLLVLSQLTKFSPSATTWSWILWAEWSKWDGNHPWISSRCAKTCEFVARVAVQLAHIEVTMEILQQYVTDKNMTDCNDSVLFEPYSDLRGFLYAPYPSVGNVSTIKGKFFTAAFMDITVAKNRKEINRIVWWRQKLLLELSAPYSCLHGMCR